MARLSFFERLAHLLAAAPRDAHLRRFSLAESDDLERPVLRCELLENRRFLCHPREHARAPPGAPLVQLLLRCHVAHRRLRARLDPRRHRVRRGDLRPGELFRLPAAGREEEQRLRLAREPELLDQTLVRGQLRLAIECSRPHQATQRAKALLEDGMHSIRAWEVLPLIRQPAVALQQPRLTTEQHAF